MPCFYGKAERERAELQDLLQLANAQREEQRKAADAAHKQIEEMRRALAAVASERAAAQAEAAARAGNEARLVKEVGSLREQVGGLEQALRGVEASAAGLEHKLASTRLERDSATSEARKLTKEREYLKHRVDRMQKALGMLESVLDDTLRDSMGGAGVVGRGSEQQRGQDAAAMLRQSKDWMSELLRDTSAPASSAAVHKGRLSQVSERSAASSLEFEDMASPRDQRQMLHA